MFLPRIGTIGFRPGIATAHAVERLEPRRLLAATLFEDSNIARYAEYGPSAELGGQTFFALKPQAVRTEVSSAAWASFNGCQAPW